MATAPDSAALAAAAAAAAADAPMASAPAVRPREDDGAVDDGGNAAKRPREDGTAADAPAAPALPMWRGSMATEAVFGIATYLTSTPGFFGVIKSRYEGATRG